MNPPGTSFQTTSGSQPTPTRFQATCHPKNEMYKSSNPPSGQTGDPNPNMDRYQQLGYPPNEIYNPTPGQLGSASNAMTNSSAQMGMGGMHWDGKGGTGGAYDEVQMQLQTMPWTQMPQAQSQVMDAYGSGSSMGSVNVTLQQQQQQAQQQHEQQHQQSQPYRPQPNQDTNLHAQPPLHPQQHPQQSRNITPYAGAMAMGQMTFPAQPSLQIPSQGQVPQPQAQQHPSHAYPIREQPPTTLMAQPRTRVSPSNTLASPKAHVPHSGELYARLSSSIAISNHFVTAHVLFAILLNLGGVMRIQRDNLWNQLVALLNIPLVCDSIVLENYCETGVSKCTQITSEVVIHKYLTELRYQEADLLRSLMVGYSITLARIGRNPFAPSIHERSSPRPASGSASSPRPASSSVSSRRQSESLDPRRKSRQSSISSEQDNGWQDDPLAGTSGRRSRRNSARSPLIERSSQADLMQAAMSPAMRRGSKRSSASADQSESFRAVKVSRFDHGDNTQQPESSGSESGGRPEMDSSVQQSRTSQTAMPRNLPETPCDGHTNVFSPGPSFQFGYQNGSAAEILTHLQPLSPTSFPTQNEDSFGSAAITNGSPADVPAIAIQPSSSAILGPDGPETMLGLPMSSHQQSNSAIGIPDILGGSAGFTTELTPEQVREVEELFQRYDGEMELPMGDRAVNEAYFDSLENGTGEDIS